MTQLQLFYNISLQQPFSAQDSIKRLHRPPSIQVHRKNSPKVTKKTQKCHKKSVAHFVFKFTKSTGILKINNAPI